MTITRRDLPVWLLAGIFGLLHLAVAGRYDVFRNELYFIICGRHPAFGYVDQPPLVPLLAAATQAFGNATWLLRVPAVLAAIAIIPLTAGFARLLGAEDLGAWFAALAAAIAPMLLGISTILTTETFEPIAWTGLAFLVARAWSRNDRRALLWAGLVAGVALETKYGMAIWLIALAAGMAATSARRMFAWRELWLGALIAAVIAAPSVVWQAVHGWPFLEVTSNHSAGNLTGSPLGFFIGQAIGMNLLLAPLWIAGIAGPFLGPRLRAFRFLSVAFPAAAAIVIASHGKDYYLVPAYPSLFALGAAACGRIPRWVAATWSVGAVALSAVAAPVVLPLLDPPALARYLDRTHLRPRPDEAAGIGAPLTQVFSDELGWRSFEKQVAAVYNSLPPEDRAHAAIMAVDYGEAAALDYYGPADGLPPAISGQNQYFLWGAHGYDGSVIIHVNGRPETWARFCQASAVAGSFGAPYAMPYENDRPIILCHGLKRNLSDTWDRFKRYE
jgi:4-amino-4-deoxy-L-arabinose transferase-like glycosyltransferase